MGINDELPSKGKKKIFLPRKRGRTTKSINYEIYSKNKSPLEEWP